MKHLLITEDDHFIAKILREQFEAAGYDVALAYNGEETLKSLGKLVPQALILDLGLPDMSGVDVLRVIRKNPDTKTLPVIVVSNSYCFSGIAQAAWNAGATQFINKEECDIPHLISQIDGFVEGRHQHHSEPVETGLKRPMVLIVDDDPIVHGVLEFFMHQAGFDVKSAMNGAVALEMMKEISPDIMIIDGYMPGIDGYHVVDIIKEDPELSHMPIIMMTTEDDEPTRELLKQHGVVEYVVKPFNLNKLVDMVREHMLKDTKKEAPRAESLLR